MTNRRMLHTEVLLASGQAGLLQPGQRADGTSPDYLTAHEATVIAQDQGVDYTWADILTFQMSLALSQTSDAPLRSCLIALAGRAVAWINDIDARNQEAA